MTSRRTFFRRASGIVAAAACALYIPSERLEYGVPRAFAQPARPTLYADGIHDDAPAIQWMLDNEGAVFLKNATYRLESTVVGKSGMYIDLRDSVVLYRDQAFHGEAGVSGQIINNRFKPIDYAPFFGRGKG